MKFKSNIWFWLERYSWPIKIFVTLILFWAIWFLYFKDTNIDTKLGLALMEISANPLTSATIAFVIFLSFVNWGLESVKWNILANKVSSMSFFKAILGTFSGITFSAFMPNRSGEFAGRIIFMPTGYRTRGIIASFIGSYAQFSTTLIFGGIGLILFSVLASFKFYITVALLTSYLIFLIGWTFTFFNPDLLYTALKRLIKNQKILGFAKTLKHFDFATQKKVLFLSMLRYMTFSIQFYLLLKLFLVDSNILELAAIIPSSFFINTLVPSITISELGIRELINIELFKEFSQQSAPVVFASLMLWTINIALPSFLGVFCILGARIKK